MSHCVKHEQCPECAKLGKDRSGNNLAIYSDGGSHCFSCGYHQSATGISSFKESQVGVTRTLGLPRDVDEKLPQVAWDFLGQYQLTERDAKVHLMLWSEEWKRLCFPIFDDTGLIAWQGRYLGAEHGKAKWFSQGDLKNILHVVGHKQSNMVILTEDLLSAIKVSKVGNFAVSPIFGSHVSSQRILRLKQYYGILGMWLDKDKQKESAKFARDASLLGMKSYSIITDLDPKCYTLDQIRLLTMNE